MELLLTFEEYCAEEGDFAGERGAAFAELFPQARSRACLCGLGGGLPWACCAPGETNACPADPTLTRPRPPCIPACLNPPLNSTRQVAKLCYDHDLLSEEAILDWAAEKAHAGSEDRRFVDLCADFLAWLEDAEEESSEEEDSE